MKNFKGKTAVITGGAGGLGLAVGLRLAKGGATIALWDVNESRLNEAEAAIKKAGGKARGYVVDVTDYAAVERAADKVRADLGPVDILDNNAGIVHAADFLDADVKDLGKIIDVNLRSYFWCTKVFLPGMVERGSGHIIMIASAAGMVGTPGMASYSATKHAVVGFGESLRLELRKSGDTGIGITIVCPSLIKTGMFKGAKAPRLTPWLTTDAIADKIISGVKANRAYVREPFMVKLLPLLKAVPSVKWMDFLGDFTGLNETMDTYSAGPRAPSRAERKKAKR